MLTNWAKTCDEAVADVLGRLDVLDLSSRVMVLWEALYRARIAQFPFIPSDEYNIANGWDDISEAGLHVDNPDFVASLVDYFEPTFQANWGEEYLYGDDADGRRGRMTCDLESIEAFGLPKWVPQEWETAMCEWAMKHREFDE